MRLSLDIARAGPIGLRVVWWKTQFFCPLFMISRVVGWGFLLGSCDTEKLVVYVDVDGVVGRVGFGWMRTDRSVSASFLL